MIKKQQCVEFGQVAILVVLFFALKYKTAIWVDVAFSLALVTVLIPYLFFPFAFLWLGLSKILSVVGPVILMPIIFFVVVMPVGLFRKLMGNDNLKLRQFKKASGSVMHVRDHVFTQDDLIHTF
ncbi:hypothetical protein [Mucilaginibacter jinjuensis]|uniref:AI-2E family transporter n=1 Tax=Mucilaginibacter jinjuensis TaxID=1176721 RepID=A0ABY7T1U1_9SPHI|nr:hypothetical protein [Mucilaginibacter jinjuensis]WCT10409.1 hypothetical protein PQO05_16865 [Mucilaginibacter jinjuensis]